MLKSSIVIVALLMTGCTINGKNLNELMGHKDNSVKKDKGAPEDIMTEKVEKSSSKIHFKWANKEYHDGEEDINFTVNKKD